MSKASSQGKHLIRNSSIPVKGSAILEEAKKSKKVHFVDSHVSDSPFIENSGFVAPEFSTVLHLTKAVDDLRNSKFGLQCSSERLRCKNVNFALEEKLYQDLIDVSLPAGYSKKHCQNHNCAKSNFKKDPNPNYEKLITYQSPASYIFTHSLKPSIRKEKIPYNGMSLHDSLTNWKAL